MNIIVVGSTGRTGLEIVQQALEQGLNVHAWARSPDKMTIQHPALQVSEVDILHSDLNAAIKGANAIIVSLGGAQLKDTSTRSEGTKRLVEAMKAQGVDRLVVVSTAGVGDSFNQLSPQGQHVVRTVIKEAVEDHGRQEEIVRNSGLRWTIGRPGGLGSGARGEYIADAEGIIEIAGIDRANVAHFTLQALTDDSYVGKIYGLRNA